MGVVIGLGYKMHQGKNVVARTIIEEFGTQYNIKEYSFARALKDEINHDLMIYGEGDWSRLFSYYRKFEHVPDYVKQDDNPDMSDPLCPYGKQRTLLQWWGVHRREQDANYWVKKVATEVKQENPTVALITDLRFPNEFYWVKSFARDGITVKVERLGYSNGENAEHISEKALDGYEFDYIIQAHDNNLHELKKDAIDFFGIVQKNYYMPPEFHDWSI